MTMWLVPLDTASHAAYYRVLKRACSDTYAALLLAKDLLLLPSAPSDASNASHASRAVASRLAKLLLSSSARGDEDGNDDDETGFTEDDDEDDEEDEEETRLPFSGRLLARNPSSSAGTGATETTTFAAANPPSAPAWAPAASRVNSVALPQSTLASGSTATAPHSQSQGGSGGGGSGGGGLLSLFSLFGTGAAATNATAAGSTATAPAPAASSASGAPPPAASPYTALVSTAAPAISRTAVEAALSVPGNALLRVTASLPVLALPARLLVLDASSAAFLPKRIEAQSPKRAVMSSQMSARGPVIGVLSLQNQHHHHHHHHTSSPADGSGGSGGSAAAGAAGGRFRVFDPSIGVSPLYELLLPTDANNERHRFLVAAYQKLLQRLKGGGVGSGDAVVSAPQHQHHQHHRRGTTSGSSVTSESTSSGVGMSGGSFSLNDGQLDKLAGMFAANAAKASSSVSGASVGSLGVGNGGAGSFKATTTTATMMVKRRASSSSTASSASSASSSSTSSSSSSSVPSLGSPSGEGGEGKGKGEGGDGSTSNAKGKDKNASSPVSGSSSTLSPSTIDGVSGGAVAGAGGAGAGRTFSSASEHRKFLLLAPDHQNDTTTAAVTDNDINAGGALVAAAASSARTPSNDDGDHSSLRSGMTGHSGGGGATIIMPANALFRGADRKGRATSTGSVGSLSASASASHLVSLQPYRQQQPQREISLMMPAHGGSDADPGDEAASFIPSEAGEDIAASLEQQAHEQQQQQQQQRRRQHLQHQQQEEEEEQSIRSGSGSGSNGISPLRSPNGGVGNNSSSGGVGVGGARAASVGEGSTSSGLGLSGLSLGLGFGLPGFGSSNSKGSSSSANGGAPSSTAIKRRYGAASKMIVQLPVAVAPPPPPAPSSSAPLLPLLSTGSAGAASAFPSALSSSSSSSTSAASSFYQMASSTAPQPLAQQQQQGGGGANKHNSAALKPFRSAIAAQERTKLGLPVYQHQLQPTPLHSSSSSSSPPLYYEGGNAVNVASYLPSSGAIMEVDLVVVEPMKVIYSEKIMFLVENGTSASRVLVVSTNLATRGFADSLRLENLLTRLSTAAVKLQQQQQGHQQGAVVVAASLSSFPDLSSSSSSSTASGLSLSVPSSSILQTFELPRGELVVDATAVHHHHQQQKSKGKSRSRSSNGRHHGQQQQPQQQQPPHLSLVIATTRAQYCLSPAGGGYRNLPALIKSLAVEALLLPPPPPSSVAATDHDGHISALAQSVGRAETAAFALNLLSSKIYERLADDLCEACLSLELDTEDGLARTLDLEEKEEEGEGRSLGGVGAELDVETHTERLARAIMKATIILANNKALEGGGPVIAAGETNSAVRGSNAHGDARSVVLQRALRILADAAAAPHATAGAKAALKAFLRLLVPESDFSRATAALSSSSSSSSSLAPLANGKRGGKATAAALRRRPSSFLQVIRGHLIGQDDDYHQGEQGQQQGQEHQNQSVTKEEGDGGSIIVVARRPLRSRASVALLSGKGMRSAAKLFLADHRRQEEQDEEKEEKEKEELSTASAASLSSSLSLSFSSEVLPSFVSALIRRPLQLQSNPGLGRLGVLMRHPLLTGLARRIYTLFAVLAATSPVAFLSSSSSSSSAAAAGGKKESSPSGGLTKPIITLAACGRPDLAVLFASMLLAVPLPLPSSSSSSLTARSPAPASVASKSSNGTPSPKPFTYQPAAVTKGLAQPLPVVIKTAGSSGTGGSSATTFSLSPASALLTRPGLLPLIASPADRAKVANLALQCQVLCWPAVVMAESDSNPVSSCSYAMSKDDFRRWLRLNRDYSPDKAVAFLAAHGLVEECLVAAHAHTIRQQKAEDGNRGDGNEGEEDGEEAEEGDEAVVWRPSPMAAFASSSSSASSASSSSTTLPSLVRAALACIFNNSNSNNGSSTSSNNGSGSKALSESALRFLSARGYAEGLLALPHLGASAPLLLRCILWTRPFELKAKLLARYAPTHLVPWLRSHSSASSSAGASAGAACSSDESGQLALIEELRASLEEDLLRSYYYPEAEEAAKHHKEAIQAQLLAEAAKLTSSTTTRSTMQPPPSVPVGFAKHKAKQAKQAAVEATELFLLVTAKMTGRSIASFLQEGENQALYRPWYRVPALLRHCTENKDWETCEWLYANNANANGNEDNDSEAFKCALQYRLQGFKAAVEEALQPTTSQQKRTRRLAVALLHFFADDGDSRSFWATLTTEVEADSALALRLKRALADLLFFSLRSPASSTEEPSVVVKAKALPWPAGLLTSLAAFAATGTTTE